MMKTRREFIKIAAGLAGMMTIGCGSERTAQSTQSQTRIEPPDISYESFGKGGVVKVYNSPKIDQIVVGRGETVALGPNVEQVDRIILNGGTLLTARGDRVVSVGTMTCLMGQVGSLAGSPIMVEGDFCVCMTRLNNVCFKAMGRRVIFNGTTDTYRLLPKSYSGPDLEWFQKERFRHAEICNGEVRWFLPRFA